VNISQSVTVNGGQRSGPAAPALGLLAIAAAAVALVVFVGLPALLAALAWFVFSLALLVLAAAFLARTLRTRRETFRPIGPEPVVDGAVQVQVSTGPSAIAGRRCAQCPGVPAAAVLVSAAGDVVAVCAAHLTAARLRLSTIPLVSSSKELTR